VPDPHNHGADAGTPSGRGCHLQGRSAQSSYNHHGPLCEGRGLTHALTDTSPTDLTVATHSPLGAQPRSDRILRLPCGRLRPAAPYMHMHIALPTTLHVHVRARCPQARVPQLQPVGKQERSKCAIGLQWALVRKAARVPVVETGECRDVETRARPPDPIVMANAFAELRYCIDTLWQDSGNATCQHESGFNCEHNFAHTLRFIYYSLPSYIYVYSLSAGPRDAHIYRIR
jgi:hypothetical protein